MFFLFTCTHTHVRRHARTHGKTPRELSHGPRDLRFQGGSCSGHSGTDVSDATERSLRSVFPLGRQSQSYAGKQRDGGGAGRVVSVSHNRNFNPAFKLGPARSSTVQHGPAQPYHGYGQTQPGPGLPGGAGPLPRPGPSGQGAGIRVAGRAPEIGEEMGEAGGTTGLGEDQRYQGTQSVTGACSPQARGTGPGLRLLPREQQVEPLAPRLKLQLKLKL